MAQTAENLAAMGALKDMMLKMKGQQGGQPQAAGPGAREADLQARMQMEQQQQALMAQMPGAAAPQQAQAGYDQAMQQKQMAMQQAMMQQQGATQGPSPQLAQYAPSLMSAAQPEMNYRQMAMQNKAAAQASLPQRAPLLQRDMMRKQMAGMMGPQPQPAGARAQLMNAKRGMMQGGRGGRGAIQTALRSQSERQMQRPQ